MFDLRVLNALIFEDVDTCTTKFAHFSFDRTWGCTPSCYVIYFITLISGVSHCQTWNFNVVQNGSVHIFNVQPLIDHEKEANQICTISFTRTEVIPMLFILSLILWLSRDFKCGSEGRCGLHISLDADNRNIFLIKAGNNCLPCKTHI